MKQFIFILFLIFSLNIDAQTEDEFRNSYDAFKQQAQEKYGNFRNEANRQYVEFVKQAWQQHNTLP